MDGALEGLVEKQAIGKVQRTGALYAGSNPKKHSYGGRVVIFALRYPPDKLRQTDFILPANPCSGGRAAMA